MLIKLGCDTVSTMRVDTVYSWTHGDTYPGYNKSVASPPGVYLCDTRLPPYDIYWGR